MDARFSSTTVLKMSSPKFSFGVFPSAIVSSENGEAGLSEVPDCIYRHPSSEEAIFDTYGAISTLLDLSRSIFPSDAADFSPNTSTTELTHDATTYTVASMNDSRSNLLLLFALERNSSSCSPQEILQTVYRLLGFLSMDIATSLADAHFRSDLDGMVFHVVNSVIDHWPLNDISLSLSAFDQAPETEHLDAVMLSFEAGDIFDQDAWDGFTGSVYVIGTSVFFKEVLIASHKASSLLQDVCLFMRLHRKGFRRLREVNTGEDKARVKTSLIRVFPSDKKNPAEMEVYLVWCSKEDTILCTCVELFGIEQGNLSATAALLEIVVRGCQKTLAHPVVDKCGRLLKRKAGFFPWQNSGRSGKQSSTSSSERSERSLSEKMSVSGMSTSSKGSHSPSTSSSTSTTSDASTVIRVSVSPAPSAGPSMDLAFRLVIDKENALLSFQSFLDDQRKLSVVPPSLQKDFMMMVTRIRAQFKKKRNDRQELALRISYPPPNLSRFYWVSGWNLPEKLKELFVCYPDGAEESALLQAFTV